MPEATENTATTTESTATEAQAVQPDPAALQAELEQIRTALKKANKEAETTRLKLKEREDADLSEVEKAQKAAADAQSRLAEYEATVTRQRVALAKGIPAELVDRLRGSTEDEIAADADALLALVKAPNAVKADHSQGARGTTKGATSGELFAQFAQSQFTT